MALVHQVPALSLPTQVPQTMALVPTQDPQTMAPVPTQVPQTMTLVPTQDPQTMALVHQVQALDLPTLVHTQPLKQFFLQVLILNSNTMQPIE
ncbi:hypothetical protein RNJ44_03978 [Nakaseomyces bracarensis]|uniref:Uncharacterized protein n=1 Tax=Nakaseomyces bracarensis TaxID=273131 RepID=A0ABR4NTK5_9SACH